MYTFYLKCNLKCYANVNIVYLYIYKNGGKSGALQFVGNPISRHAKITLSDTLFYTKGHKTMIFFVEKNLNYDTDQS